MADQRLPIVNQDDGTWGDILRQYLMKEHVNDDTDNPLNGSHKNITIIAGTAGAGTAPLKFTSGTLLTTPEPGAMEFAGDNYYLTQTTGSTRKKIALYDVTGSQGDLYYRDGVGQLAKLAIGNTGHVLSVSGGVPSWQTPSVDGSNITNLDDSVAALMTGDYFGTPTAIDTGVLNLFTVIWAFYVGGIIIDDEDLSDESTDSTASRRAIKTYVDTAVSGKEGAITAGTTAQYWRGDKSWQTLNKAAVGLSNVDNTSDATKNSAAAVLTNKTIVGGNNNLSDIALSSLNTTGSATNNTFLRGDGQWTAAFNAVYSANVGDGSNTSYAITHNLGTRNVNISIYDAVTYEEVNCDKYRTSENVVTLVFGAAPAINAYVCVVSNGSVTTTLNSTDVGDTTALGRTLMTVADGAAARAAIGAGTGDVTQTGNQTLTNKTLTSPTINSPTVSNGTLTSPTLTSPAIANPTFTGTISGSATWPILNQNTTGSAATLATSRTIQTNLASTSAVGFDGSANVTPGVTGTLPVTSGGTGRATGSTAYGIIAAGATATGAQQTIAPGSSGQFLKSAGASALASFATIQLSDLSDSASVATLTGNQVLTNKTIHIGNNTITGAVRGSVNGTTTSLTLWTGTQAQYDAIGTKDNNFIYIIT